MNLRGEVIGINTAIVATGQGIGFAIPANMVKRITSQLMDRGKVTRGWIGIAMEPLTTELAQSFGLREPRGAVVARVYPGGPAAAAGLEKNDVVVTFEGVPIEDYRQLQRLSSDAEVGKNVKLEIIRNRERRTIQLKVAEAPDRLPPTAPPHPAAANPRRDRVGSAARTQGTGSRHIAQGSSQVASDSGARAAPAPASQLSDEGRDRRNLDLLSFDFAHAGDARATSTARSRAAVPSRVTTPP